MAEHDNQGTRTIVVGVDGSDGSADAARWAFGQAALTGSHVEVITAWRWPSSWGAAIPMPTGFDPAGDARSMADEITGPLADEFPTVNIHTRIVEGHPAEVLVEASRYADLLVVSSRGHGEFSGMLIGSVSLYCATRASCPVLVYREPEQGNREQGKPEKGK